MVALNELIVATPDLSPRDPPSGIARKGCYLSKTMDCDGVLTREHVLSKAILRQLDGIVLSGMPWQQPGESAQVGINAATAKILCARHNSSMSALDDVAGRFFKRLQWIYAQTDVKHARASKPTATIFSGETLERWMLKALLGAFYGKHVAKHGRPMLQTNELNLDRALRSLLNNCWEPEAGLYIHAQASTVISVHRGVVMTPLHHRATGNVVGLQLNFAGLDFFVGFDTSQLDARDDPAGWTYRPSELRFQIHGREHVLFLTWPLGTKERAIRFAYTGSDQYWLNGQMAPAS